MDNPLLHRLAVALGIGLIVGLERGWKTRGEHGGQRLAGQRTFALAGLLGGVLAALSADDRHWVLAAGTLAVGALVAGAYWLTARETGDFGMTTELAMLATFALGAIAALGAPFEASAVAVVMALVLGLKAEFHRAVERLERHELLATLQLAAIALVLVPLLPARDLGPWQAINPRATGMLVLLIAGLSYVGYFAVRELGPRLGILLTALFGGMSSSTAVAVAYARRARTQPNNVALLGAGIALAAATMVPRLAVEIAAVNVTVLHALWPTLAVLMAVPLVAAAVIALRHDGAAVEPMPLSNPLQLRTALVIGGLLAVLSVAAAGLQRSLGDAGVYAMAAVAGLFDVDAIALTLARQGGSSLPIQTAERGIVLAALVNTAMKAVLAASLGGAPLLRTGALILAAAMIAAGVTAAVTLS